MPHHVRRPRVWRQLGVISGVLIVLGILAIDVRRLVPGFHLLGGLGMLADAALAAVWVIVGALMIAAGRRHLAGERDVRRADERRVWNFYLNVFGILGYLYLVLMTAALLRLNLSGLLLGGAITGVIVGIAAQSALGNLFGGMLVLLLHPYSVGQRITMRSSNFGGVEYTGTVREVTLFYTALDSGSSRLVIPNSTTVASVARIEGTADWESMAVPVPYRITPDAVKEALAEAGLDEPFTIESMTADAYIVRVRIPASSGPPKLVAVMAELLEKNSAS